MDVPTDIRWHTHTIDTWVALMLSSDLEIERTIISQAQTAARSQGILADS